MRIRPPRKYFFPNPPDMIQKVRVFNSLNMDKIYKVWKIQIIYPGMEPEYILKRQFLSIKGNINIRTVPICSKSP